MSVIDLNGAWEVESTDGDYKAAAQVPGDIYGDLLAAGLIPDPYYRDVEKDVQWIGETDWNYSRIFHIDESFLANREIRLQCEGLDTIAVIMINGKEVARADNMYRSWHFDVRDFLVVGENEIQISFSSAMEYVQEKNKDRRMPASEMSGCRLDSGSWIRKQPCNFGWDWGPGLVTCGIWRPIQLVAVDKGEIQDVLVQQIHHNDSVHLSLDVSISQPGDSSLHCNASLLFDGQIIAQQEGAVYSNELSISLEVEDPKLWWPAGMGAQPLYELCVVLLDESENEIDRWVRRIGLRELKLIREKDAWGESFAFAANGKPFFSKGANWIPADAILSRVKKEEYRRLLSDALEANMNMIRVWGGGIYERDEFYDLCDELGLCVWQDFMFACSTYPTFDAGFMKNVEAEVRDNVRRIRHHACLALWCGNNELEMHQAGEAWTEKTMPWSDYSKLFDTLIADVVAELDPQTDYWPSSPHSPCGDRNDHNNPTCGNAHLWDVWHGREPFEWYRTCEHRFNSEFGFQSFPEPQTVYGFTEEEDRNITAPVMEWHQRSGIGNTVIMQYMLDWFRMPKDFEMTLWLSQIQQGMAIKYAVEHWRRSMPRGMGTLYWQLNDCWPAASWSSIDSLGRWKALHYMARHFYAPVLISGVEDTEAGSVDIHVTNDRLSAFQGEVHVLAMDTAGTIHREIHVEADIDAQSSKSIKVLDLTDAIEKSDMDNLLIWLDLRENGASISKNLVLMSRPKRLHLIDPHIDWSLEKIDAYNVKVKLTSSAPALWAWVEIAGFASRFSDNFLHLRPGVEENLCITLPEEIDLDTLKQRFRIYSLIDSF